MGSIIFNFETHEFHSCARFIGAQIGAGRRTPFCSCTKDLRTYFYQRLEVSIVSDIVSRITIVDQVCRL